MPFPIEGRHLYITFFASTHEMGAPAAAQAPFVVQFQLLTAGPRPVHRYMSPERNSVQLPTPRAIIE